MKKLAVISIILLLLFAVVAFASVMVLHKGKVKALPDNSKVVVSGENPSRVLYDGVLVTVPPNQEVEIRKENVKKEDGEIEKRLVISGTDLKDVKVKGQNISSKGETEVSVPLDDNEKIDVIKGEVYKDGVLVDEVLVKEEPIKPAVVNQAVEKQAIKKQTVVKPVVTKTVEFPEISDYVDELVYEQAVQDVGDMSQYAPRS